MKLRPATPDDAGLMAQIHAGAFERPWREAEIAAIVETGAKGLIAGDGGFILWRAAAGEAEILTLAVLPARRREGMGRDLVDGAVQAAAAVAQEMFLEVEAGNAAARALYAAAGFAEAGRRGAYYRGADGQMRDALILRRTLNRR